ncbi:hypothetical protein P152DRAFT_447956 [Eremomyces bilateralis CBS 781.70]|uniref:Uncharacterized protein n=1 Tax=Eremomyces bilateralis CBS 781.70 TaxID=1392243 RepID=A0A6G1G9P2_9PEZI|nr:uncharacterized protein P152DRAFT_447956 [Eremomyces bilateralis CBS 781.70]KAF1814621.1 hypothetical protein P152DRAFT_447956 [Eremomyces bilateralis CBS 781.70]
MPAFFPISPPGADLRSPIRFNDTSRFSSANHSGTYTSWSPLLPLTRRSKPSSTGSAGMAIGLIIGIIVLCTLVYFALEFHKHVVPPEHPRTYRRRDRPAHPSHPEDIKPGRRRAPTDGFQRAHTRPTRTPQRTTTPPPAYIPNPPPPKYHPRVPPHFISHCRGCSPPPSTHSGQHTPGRSPSPPSPPSSYWGRHTRARTPSPPSPRSARHCRIRTPSSCSARSTSSDGSYFVEQRESKRGLPQFEEREHYRTEMRCPPLSGSETPRGRSRSRL